MRSGYYGAPRLLVALLEAVGEDRRAHAEGRALERPGVALFERMRAAGDAALIVAGAGAILDEHVVTRAVFAVGGTMYMIGALTFALVHPQTEGGQP